MTNEIKMSVAGEDDDTRMRWASLNQLPPFRAAMAMAAIHDDGSEAFIATTLALLEKQCQEVSSGDLERLEAMLTTQANVLNSIFTKYVGTAYKAKLLEQFSGYIGVALKAQNQCRQTIAVLGELQNPKRTTFIKQQNNAINQQINQGRQSETTSRTTEEQEILEKIPSQADELLETRIERMDDRTPASAK